MFTREGNGNEEKLKKKRKEIEVSFVKANRGNMKTEEKTINEIKELARD